MVNIRFVMEFDCARAGKTKSKGKQGTKSLKKTIHVVCITALQS